MTTIFESADGKQDSLQDDEKPCKKKLNTKKTKRVRVVIENPSGREDHIELSKDVKPIELKPKPDKKLEIKLELTPKLELDINIGTVQELQMLLNQSCFQNITTVGNRTVKYFSCLSGFDYRLLQNQIIEEYPLSFY